MLSAVDRHVERNGAANDQRSSIRDLQCIEEAGADRARAARCVDDDAALICTRAHGIAGELLVGAMREVDRIVLGSGTIGSEYACQALATGVGGDDRHF